MTTVPSLSHSMHALLDPAQITRLIRAALGAATPLADLRVDRLWPMDGRLAVQWSWATPTRRARLYAASTPRPTGHEDVVRSTAPADLSVSVYLPNDEVLLHTPDRDTHMAHLRTCLDGTAMAERLAALWPGAGATAIEATLVGYKPRRRAALIYRAVEPRLDQLVAKTHGRGRMADLYDRHRVLAAALADHGERVRVQVPLGHIADVNMVIFARDVGHTARLTDLDDGHQAMAALTALHATTVDGLPVHGPGEEMRIVRRWYDLMEQVSPGFGAVARPMIDTLERSEAQVDDGVRVPIHRDFYGAQVLISADHTTIIDLDTLASGHRAIDVANLLAHWLLDRSQADGDDCGWRTTLRAQLEHYEGVAGPIDRQALEYYLIAALFRLGAVHMFRTLTGQYAATLWAAGNALVRAGLGGVMV